jgi:hypothetical protein
MKTRMMRPIPTNFPKSHAEWDALASKAAKAAKRVGDGRAYPLTKAIQEGRSERLLRSFGILSETDIVREFPVPE